ncbi:hypothetical protein KIN20_013366 [Parelaphostrongylus tenuis]|uniref:Uncharacterized protein n=1 Tax=Parelaphostrongylus tenuis TaxID=148309 RepID=A0AAD5MBZ8_PARTN|nr:hypothetical protein KIN20_013366 [Parelaphostrongylus tenuis]
MLNTLMPMHLRVVPAQGLPSVNSSLLFLKQGHLAVKLEESQLSGLFRVVHTGEEVSRTRYVSIGALKEALTRACNELTTETCATILCNSTTSIS